LQRSAQNWRNLFDDESGWIRPRINDGNFLGDWDPDHLLPHHVHSWDKDENWNLIRQHQERGGEP